MHQACAIASYASSKPVKPVGATPHWPLYVGARVEALLAGLGLLMRPLWHGLHILHMATLPLISMTFVPIMHDFEGFCAHHGKLAVQ